MEALDEPRPALLMDLSSRRERLLAITKFGLNIHLNELN